MNLLFRDLRLPKLIITIMRGSVWESNGKSEGTTLEQRFGAAKCPSRSIPLHVKHGNQILQGTQGSLFDAAKECRINK